MRVVLNSVRVIKVKTGGPKWVNHVLVLKRIHIYTATFPVRQNKFKYSLFGEYIRNSWL